MEEFQSRKAARLLKVRYYPVHQHKMKERAQENEYMEYLVAAKAGIIPAGPFGCVEHAAHGVEHTAAQ